MASPYIQYDKLAAIASNGGLANVTALSNLSAVFLLSSCVVMRQRWLWQSPLEKISDSQWQAINEMIAETEYELMTSAMIGQIVPSVVDYSSYPQYLLLDGATVAQIDYPELFAVVPASWIVGTDIVLPDMTDKGIFGDGIGALGGFIGENAVILTENEMPTHTHIQNPHSHSEVIPSVTPTAAGLEPALASLVIASPSVTGSTVATNQNAGGDMAHNNIQSSLVVKWWIIAS